MTKTPSWQQDFERYRAQIDDLPALIVVDWAVPGAQKSHPVRVLVRASLRTPTDEGLLDASEAAAIDHVVGTLVDVARDGLQGIYVGRMIYAGSVILAFYVPKAQKARTDLLALLQPELAPYELAHDTQDDPKWSYYLDMLYPDPYSLAIMSSLRQLAALAEKGDRPEAVRMVDHTAFFPDGVAAKAAVKPLVEAGFRVHAPLPPRGNAPWALSFQKEADLSPTSIDAFCRAILTAIGPFAGTYDGWRSSVVSRLSLSFARAVRFRAPLRWSHLMRTSSVHAPLGFLVSLSAAGFVLGAVACGDPPAAPVAPPAPPSASAAAPKPPVNKALLGHWSTGDGSIGLVLDRTGDIAKVKLDKSNDIVQITPKEDRKHGDLVGNRFESPDGKGVLYIGVNGNVEYYGPRDTFQLRRDADAEPLGAPTVAGVPAPPKKLAYELLIEELDAISVVKKLGLKPEDSGNLAKVGEAIEKADKSLFVTYQAKTDAASFVAAPETIGGTTYGATSAGGYPLEDDSKEKLGPFGGVLRGWTTDTGGGYIRLYTPRKKKLLADKTPGLVWEAGSTSVVFVTLDGGRYRVDVSNQTVEAGAPLAKGIGPAGTWPPALQDSTYDTYTTQYLAKAGAIPATTHEQAEKIDEEWRACANKESKALQDKLDKAGNNRRKILEGHLPATRKKCAASEKKMIKLLTEFTDARNKERTALYEKAKNKLK